MMVLSVCSWKLYLASLLWFSCASGMKRKWGRERERETNVSWTQISEIVSVEAKMHLADPLLMFPTWAHTYCYLEYCSHFFHTSKIFFSFSNKLELHIGARQEYWDFFFFLICNCTQNGCFAIKVWLISNIVAAVFCLLRAAPVAYGGSQAGDLVGAVVAGLRHSHSNARSKPCLWSTPQLTATPDL